MLSLLKEVSISPILLKLTIFFIAGQISLLLALSIFYLKNMLTRLLQQYVLEKYEYYIMEAALGRVYRDSPLFKTAPFIRKILRVIIINKIMSVGGNARKGLIELYKDMGFDKYDLKLLTSSKWYHRLSAITSLTITKSEFLKNSVSKYLRDRDLSVRVASIKAISVFNCSDLLKDIAECMETLPDWVNDRIVPVLIKLNKIPYENMLKIFIGSSNKIRRYLVPLLFESDKEQALWDLTNNFETYDFETQISIVKSIGNVEHIDRITGFAEMIINSYRWELKAQLVKSLGYIKNEKSIPLLIKGLDDKNWFVRYNSAVSIALYGEKGLNILKQHAQENSGFKSDISRYIIDLYRYGFLNEGMGI